jgi:predicted metal-dependent hydrolase
MDKKVFSYGRFSYKYLLLREDRKTISLVIKPDKSIIVKAPIKAKGEEIDDFLKRKWSWMIKQINYFDKFDKKKYRKEYVSGESFYYLGRQYKLMVRKRKKESVKFSKGILQLSTKKEVRNSNHNKNLMERWYSVRASEIFTKRYKIVLKSFDYDFLPQLDIRKMNKRWGSFLSNKKIYLNPDLIKVPTNCIDYVIAHELCHMKYKKHNQEFYNLLELKCPDWELRRETLDIFSTKIS